MKADEIKLMAALRAYKSKFKYGGAPFADVVCAEQGIPFQRGMAILEKWTAKGWWIYGVSLRAGWLSDSAPQEGANVGYVSAEV